MHECVCDMYNSIDIVVVGRKRQKEEKKRKKDMRKQSERHLASIGRSQ